MKGAKVRHVVLKLLDCTSKTLILSLGPYRCSQKCHGKPLVEPYTFLIVSYSWSSPDENTSLGKYKAYSDFIRKQDCLAFAQISIQVFLSKLKPITRLWAVLKRRPFAGFLTLKPDSLRVLLAVFEEFAIF